jgi:hypothetical protein
VGTAIEIDNPNSLDLIDRINARDRVGQKPSKRMIAQQEKAAIMSDKRTEFKTKEDSTMAMLR